MGKSQPGYSKFLTEYGLRKVSWTLCAWVLDPQEVNGKTMDPRTKPGCKTQSHLLSIKFSLPSPKRKKERKERRKKGENEKANELRKFFPPFPLKWNKKAVEGPGQFTLERLCISDNLGVQAVKASLTHGIYYTVTFAKDKSSRLVQEGHEELHWFMTAIYPRYNQLLHGFSRHSFWSWNP